LAEEVTGSKRPDIIGPGQLALGWWVRWGGRMRTGSVREGGGVFFTADLCWHFSKVCILLIVTVGQKGQQAQNFEVSNKKKHIQDVFLSIMVNKFRIFIKI
jgi:hypothetical protein